MKCREISVDFFPAAAGEEGYPGLGWIEVVLGGVCLAWKRGRGGLRGEEGMADELGIDAALAIESLFEGEDNEHFGDALLNPVEAASFPGPELRRDEPDDRDASATEMSGEAKVDVREVDEDSYGGTVAADGTDKAAVAGIDVGDVAENFCYAHDCNVFGADDLLLMLAGHLGAAEAGEGCVGEAGAKGSDYLSAVGIPGGFASREEDARIGDGGDASSLSFVTGDEVVVPLTWSARWLRVG